MSHTNITPARGQVAAACRDICNSPGLPFAQHLPEQQIEQALAESGAAFRRRRFSPAVTLWTFLAQVLQPDPSCRAAVARVLAWRAAQGLAAGSADTGGYCKARDRLPTAALRRLCRDTGRDVLAKAATPWLWKGRAVKVVDGTGVSMPDTAANQKEYPQSRRCKPGCGFPLIRLVVLFSLAVGTALDVAFGKHHGQGQGEQSLFRQLLENLAPGDVLLGDRNFCDYWVIAAAQARQVDTVLRLNTCWQKSLHGCRRLANGDRLMRLTKPRRRPPWLDATDHAAVVAELWIRVVSVHVRQRGFRTKALRVATTLLEPEQASSAELADLYRTRWQAELDLRSLKQSLQMDVLRCKDPEMVRKEIWAHLLAYNLLRGVMAQAARKAGCKPRELSVTATAQLLNAFVPYLRVASDQEARAELWEVLLKAVGQHRVGQRPDRVEPRRTKRRPKNYAPLNVPRRQARAGLRAAS